MIDNFYQFPPGESIEDDEELFSCPYCGIEFSRKDGWKFCGNKECKIYLDIDQVVKGMTR